MGTRTQFLASWINLIHPSCDPDRVSWWYPSKLRWVVAPSSSCLPVSTTGGPKDAQSQHHASYFTRVLLWRAGGPKKRVGWCPGSASTTGRPPQNSSQRPCILRRETWSTDFSGVWITARNPDVSPESAASWPLWLALLSVWLCALNRHGTGCCAERRPQGACGGIPHVMGLCPAESSSFYLAAEYPRPTLPFLVINTWEVLNLKSRLLYFSEQCF